MNTHIIKTAFTLNQVSKNYGQLQALQKVSLNIQFGQIHALLGDNGAGKSTTLKIMANLLLPSSGDLEVWGQKSWGDALKTYQKSEDQNLGGRLLGYAPENPPLYNDLNVRDYLNFMAMWMGNGPKLTQMRRKEIKLQVDQEVNTYLDLFQMQENEMALVGSLSKGQKQKLNLIQALLWNPPLLILDEPTSGLDPHSSFNFLNWLKAQEGKKCIIFSSHNLTLVEDLCSEASILFKGELVSNFKLKSSENLNSGSRHYQIHEFCQNYKDADPTAPFGH